MLFRSRRRHAAELVEQKKRDERNAARRAKYAEAAMLVEFERLAAEDAKAEKAKKAKGRLGSLPTAKEWPSPFRPKSAPVADMPLGVLVDVRCVVVIEPAQGYVSKDGKRKDPARVSDSFFLGRMTREDVQLLAQNPAAILDRYRRATAGEGKRFVPTRVLGYVVHRWEVERALGDAGGEDQ